MGRNRLAESYNEKEPLNWRRRDSNKLSVLKQGSKTSGRPPRHHPWLSSSLILSGFRTKVLARKSLHYCLLSVRFVIWDTYSRYSFWPHCRSPRRDECKPLTERLAHCNLVHESLRTLPDTSSAFSGGPFRLPWLLRVRIRESTESH